MEQCVSEMMSMLYNVDLFMDRPQEKTAGGKDPKTALEHISELFHVSPSLYVAVKTIADDESYVQMYQSEMMAKREALSDLTCEEIQAEEFAERWRSMAEVQDGRKQTMDDLADLLAAFG